MWNGTPLQFNDINNDINIQMWFLFHLELQLDMSDIIFTYKAVLTPTSIVYNGGMVIMVGWL